MADPGLPLLGVTAKQVPVVFEAKLRLTPKLSGELPVAFSVEDVVSDEDGTQARAVLQALLCLHLRSPWVCSRAVFQGSQKHWVLVLIFSAGGRKRGGAVHPSVARPAPGFLSAGLLSLRSSPQRPIPGAVGRPSGWSTQ